MKICYLALLVAFLPAVLPGAEKTTVAAAEGGPAAKTHTLRGVVAKVMPESGQVRVKHEAIPGYMPAMTMAFHAAPADLARLLAGDTIAATLELRGEEFWLSAIKILNRPAK